MGFFGAAHGGLFTPTPPTRLTKICYIYPTMMKLGKSYRLPKEDQKIYINHVTHPMNFADISIFHRKLANFAISRNTDIDCNLIHNSQFSNSYLVFKYFFNKHGYNFDDVSKNGYPRPL